LKGEPAAALPAKTDKAIEAEVRVFVGGPGGARIPDLHVWRIGPEAHASIISVTGGSDGKTVRDRLKPVHEVGHLTAECH
jgi:Co/Zn/Cd efflux system component